MRILVHCKRQYTGRDLLDDGYGRLYEIPEALARRGHQVMGIATSYRRRSGERWISAAGVEWSTINMLPAGPLQWLRHAHGLQYGLKPDVLWASSDALHCISGVHLARRLGIPAVLDLYDNYDHFGLTRIPGVRAAYHSACRQADGLSVVSHTLARHVHAEIAPTVPVTVIVNGVRGDLFRPLPRAECRMQLGLPHDARIIGCAGAMDGSRGIADLFEAFILLAATDPALYLVFAGPRDATPARYRHPRIIDLGTLAWERVPQLINALDVAVICNRDSSFGRYCFPLKLYEAVACGVPVVAAAVGDVQDMLRGSPHALYPPGDLPLLADAIRRQLDEPQSMGSLPVPEWDSLAVQVEQALIQAVRRYRS